MGSCSRQCFVPDTKALLPRGDPHIQQAALVLPGSGSRAHIQQGPGNQGQGRMGKSAWGTSRLGHSSARPLGGGPLQEPREGTGPGALGRSAVTVSAARRVPGSPVDRFPSPRPREDPSKGSTGGWGESQLGGPQPPPSNGGGGAPAPAPPSHQPHLLISQTPRTGGPTALKGNCFSDLLELLQGRPAPSQLPSQF